MQLLATKTNTRNPLIILNYYDCCERVWHVDNGLRHIAHTLWPICDTGCESFWRRARWELIQYLAWFLLS